jgi:AcrR family transcriptional regulator
MVINQNSVKTGLPRSYHHGALRPALIAAAEAVLAETGVDRFSLRETARRAGVSASAPAHHFGDARGLLTALAAAAFVELGDALESASRTLQGAQAVRAMGVAYVGFALGQRASFDLMWRESLLDCSNAEYAAAARRAFSLLDRAVRGEAGGTCAPTDPAAAPAVAAWAMVHGFARLALDGTFGLDNAAPQHAADMLLPAVLDHLEV